MLSLVNIHLQLTSLRFKLLILLLLLFDLAAELQLHSFDGLDAFFAVLLKLSSLNIQTFFVIFFLLNVLALNDFLSLLCDTVKLHILGALLKVNNL